MSPDRLSGRRTAFRPLSVAVLLAMLSVVALAGPAAADFEWGETGRTGPHTLIDSMSESSVRCNYATTSIEPQPEDTFIFRGKLDRLDVRPPQVWSVRGTQKVGWRFMVERVRNPRSTFDDPWRETYRSAIQTATATEASSAAFTPMYVPVEVPRGTLVRNHGYRVMIKMFWYRADGSVQGTSQHLLSYFETYFLEQVRSIAPPWCEARISWLQQD
jgi:hypothetical protein